jgi:NAD-dependent SIR2 family protein deacetylase
VSIPRLLYGLDAGWFGELFPDLFWEQALQASGRCDIFLSIGTMDIAASRARLAEERVSNTPEGDSYANQWRYFLTGPAGTIVLAAGPAL